MDEKREGEFILSQVPPPRRTRHLGHPNYIQGRLEDPEAAEEQQDCGDGYAFVDARGYLCRVWELLGSDLAGGLLVGARCGDWRER